MSDVLLHLANVRHEPLRDVGLQVRQGELVGLVGPAAAGKTTLLRLAAGAVAPDRGSVRIAGHPAHSATARRVAGYAPAQPVFPPGLTVRGALEYYAWFHGPASAASQVAAALELADLGAYAHRHPAALPFGALRRVGLAQAALGSRRLLLLDETLDGCDPAARTTLGARLGAWVWNGGAVVLATRDLAAVERLADRVVILKGGRVARDCPAVVLLHERVLEVMLDAPPPEPPPGFQVAPFGIQVDLAGRTVEAALAQCRAHRLVVRGTRVRTKSLEDVVVETEGSS